MVRTAKTIKIGCQSGARGNIPFVKNLIAKATIATLEQTDNQAVIGIGAPS